MTSTTTKAVPLRVDNLTVTLGQYTALAEVSFELLDGQSMAILGPNGAGKSTLLKAILGFIPVRSGSITVMGRHVEHVPPEWIGYVPQLKRLDRSFPALTCELVASGVMRRWPGSLPRKLHADVESALELVGAGHLIHKPLHWLSGGESQRVYLARALIRRPRLLILDEPASGIDTLGEDDLHHYLERYQEQSGAAIVLVTHDWLAARHHTKLALLLNRRQFAFGEAKSTLEKANLIELFGHTKHDHDQGVGGV